MKKQLCIIITGIALLLIGCGNNINQEDQNMYQKISMAEAAIAASRPQVNWQKWAIPILWNLAA